MLKVRLRKANDDETCQGSPSLTLSSGLSYLSGYTRKEIGEIINRRHGIYINSYKGDSFEGLALGHSTAKSSKLN
ncbi:hypothetical protein KFZ58_04440 [Virgibacillus sp. NKC19-16]|uniref:hypothetical protein n=1 Tax=Virgibacillus salidurans TaxID=2831673 RepID=UPI001F1C1EAB|nr:hypothetical protein [Virgibacillus sp. NKC19-16]UJL47172.1 hypothetical protein KFZ58_04440 [Virgibacillus sp. NKC19-16]